MSDPSLRVISLLPAREAARTLYTMDDDRVRRLRPDRKGHIPISPVIPARLTPFEATSLFNSNNRGPGIP